MTREEAIEVLRANYPDACFEQLREAVDMAIEALQNLSKPNNELQGLDLISRQDVKDALDCINGVAEVIDSLPSADCKDCIWDVCNYNRVNWDWEGDAISRQDAIEAIAKRIYHIEDGNENDALRKAICDIDALPSVNAIPYDSTVTLNSPTIIKATSTDLISRQDAIDALMNDSDWADAIPTIKSLPFAEQKTGEWIGGSDPRSI